MNDLTPQTEVIYRDVPGMVQVRESELAAWRRKIVGLLPLIEDIQVELILKKLAADMNDALNPTLSLFEEAANEA